MVLRWDPVSTILLIVIHEKKEHLLMQSLRSSWHQSCFLSLAWWEEPPEIQKRLATFTHSETRKFQLKDPRNQWTNGGKWMADARGTAVLKSPKSCRNLEPCKRVREMEDDTLTSSNTVQPPLKSVWYVCISKIGPRDYMSLSPSGDSLSKGSPIR